MLYVIDQSIADDLRAQEIHKAGGRILIKLGDQEIDFSPSFCIFLFTRDPTSHFTPDLCSRVTFVNFTVTPSGLQSQCLYQVLKAERPDVDKKRCGFIDPLSLSLFYLLSQTMQMYEFL
jgi:dynein heavy chain 1